MIVQFFQKETSPARYAEGEWLYPYQSAYILGNKVIGVTLNGLAKINTEELAVMTEKGWQRLSPRGEYWNGVRFIDEKTFKEG